MKKILVFIITILFITNVSAFSKNDKITVTLNKCVDGDTAIFNYKNEEMKVRFLAIDTPELKDDKERIVKYGNEAKDFTCNKLKNAKKIVIEFDPNSDIEDKYGRYLGWIFVDDKLLQKEIVSKGYAKVAYLYGDYKYTNELQIVEAKARKNKLKIWSEDKGPTLYQIVLIIIFIIILLIVKPKKKRKRKKNIG